MHTKYYTPTQLDRLHERRAELRDNHIHQIETEWRTLIAEIRAEMDNHTSPASATVQALLPRWQTLVQAFIGGDPEIEQSLHMHQHESPEVTSQDAVDSAMFEYMSQALQATRHPQ